MTFEAGAVAEAALGPPETTAESVGEKETSTIVIATVTNAVVSVTETVTETVTGAMAEISAPGAPR